MRLGWVKWIPRTLSCAIVILLLLFSFDVFSSNKVWYLKLIDFVMHNIPTIVLIIALFFAWNKPIIGTYFYGSMGLALSIYLLINHKLEALVAVLTIGLPMIVIGFLFYWNHRILK